MRSIKKTVSLFLLAQVIAGAPLAFGQSSTKAESSNYRMENGSVAVVSVAKPAYEPWEANWDYVSVASAAPLAYVPWEANWDYTAVLSAAPKAATSVAPPAYEPWEANWKN